MRNIIAGIEHPAYAPKDDEAWFDVPRPCRAQRVPSIGPLREPSVYNLRQPPSPIVPTQGFSLDKF